MSHSLGDSVVRGEKGTGQGSLACPATNDSRCISGASPPTVHAPGCDESNDNGNCNAPESKESSLVVIWASSTAVGVLGSDIGVFSLLGSPVPIAGAFENPEDRSSRNSIFLPMN
jgi:hypothetical protein